MVGVAGAAAVVVAVVAAVKAVMVNTLVVIPQRAHQFAFGACQVQAGGAYGFFARASVPSLWTRSLGTIRNCCCPQAQNSNRVAISTTSRPIRAMAASKELGWNMVRVSTWSNPKGNLKIWSLVGPIRPRSPYHATSRIAPPMAMGRMGRWRDGAAQ